MLEEELVCLDVESCEALGLVGVGVLDTVADVAVVRAVVVDPVVCTKDDMADEIEDVFSAVFDITELRDSAEVSLPRNSLLTSCAPTRLMTTSKENSIREAGIRANMTSQNYGRRPRSGAVVRRIEAYSRSGSRAVTRKSW